MDKELNDTCCTCFGGSLKMGLCYLENPRPRKTINKHWAINSYWNWNKGEPWYTGVVLCWNSWAAQIKVKTLASRCLKHGGLHVPCQCLFEQFWTFDWSVTRSFVQGRECRRSLSLKKRPEEPRKLKEDDMNAPPTLSLPPIPFLHVGKWRAWGWD